MDHERAAAGEKLGTCGGDDDLDAALDAEGKVIELGLALELVHLGLGDGGAVHRVPERWLKAPLDEALVVEIEEGELGDDAALVGNGLIFARPVHAQGKAREEVTELGLVSRDHFAAERYEGAAVHCACLYLFNLLHKPLGGKAVVVPTNGVEHVAPAHAEVAREDIGLGVGIDVANVKIARNRRRGRVDDVVELRRQARIPGKAFLAKPALPPSGLCLDPVVAVRKCLHAAFSRAFFMGGAKRELLVREPDAGKPQAVDLIC